MPIIIFQDIDEQVRLKLGFTSLQPISTISQSSAATVVSTSWSRGVLSTTERSSLPRLIPYTQTVSCLPNTDVGLSNEHIHQTKSKRVVSFTGSKKISPKRNLDDTRANANSHSKSPIEIFQYISSKYGTPSEQLSNLQVEGKFLTTEFDSSGVKSGPTIHYPLEANICIPTPKHVRDPTSHAAQRDQQINSSVQSTHSCNESSNKYLSREACSTTVDKRNGQIIYCNSRQILSQSDQAPSQSGHALFLSKKGEKLVFESRFESGNLQKVTQL